MTTAEKYVTAVYLVVFAVVLGYVLIMATKLARLEREVAELEELARARSTSEDEPRKAVAVG
jgi:CcmD family protein